MNDWEYVQINISRVLYDRINKFGDVEEAICQGMTEWVNIMEDEERLFRGELKVRFYVHTYFNNFSPHVIVEAISRKDKDNDFVGKMEVYSQESLLKVAEEGYGILPEEIEFVD